jgi:DNA-binding response OmpR family regulator
MRILVLETDKLLARNICNHLELFDYRTDWQVDPQEAIISVDVEPVDLVVMDVILAARSGIEFLYEFRSYPDWASVPVIIYSSVPAREVGESVAGFEQLNIKSYLYKPTTPIAQLVKSVNSVLQTVPV